MSRKLGFVVASVLAIGTVIVVWSVDWSSDSERFDRANERLISLGLEPYEEFADIHLQGKKDIGNFSFLRAFPSVGYLNLASTDVTDRGIRHVGQISLLKCLDLDETSIGDRAMKYLVPHRASLAELHLSETLITGETLPLFQKLHQLSLAGCRLTPKGIKRVARIAKTNGIGWLSIQGTPISDANLDDLMEMQCDTLVVSNAQLSNESIRRLRAFYDVEVRH